jgi:hypothetical protein
MSAARRLGLAACLLALALTPRFPDAAAQDKDKDNPNAADEATLTDAGLKHDGAALLTFFRKRTPSADDQTKLAELIKRLGDDAYTVREKASEELTAAGRVALPLLKEAVHDPDLEVSRRAERILQQLESGNDLQVVLASARLLAARKPAGAVEAVLAYLPFVEDPSAEEELHETLDVVGLSKDRADALLVKALSDKNALRRAAAAWVVGRSADKEQRGLVRERLKDDDARVRLRAAQGLLAGKEGEALPALVALVGDAPPHLARQAEEVLFGVAREKAPSVSVGEGSEAERKKCREAWEAWYRADGVKIDLARLDAEPRLLGLTLCVAWDSDGVATGRVFEIDKDGKERWSVSDVSNPVDACVIRGERFLVAEQSAQRVTERDLKGKVLWEHKVTDSLVSCKRLPNGNTWIVTYNQIMEVTKDNKVLYTHGSKHGWISHAAKLRNGNIGYMTYSGQLVEIDAKGTEIKMIKIDSGAVGLIKFEQLPNGNFLVPQQQQGKLQELDPTGKVVWSFDMPNPSAAKRLPNGNTLVCSYQGRKVVEVTRAGKVVWEKSPGAGLLNASRR